MKRLLLLTLLFPLFLQAQISGRVNRQYSVDLSYRSLTSDSTTGGNFYSYGLGFDYAWQLSGYDGKSPAYISVPLRYDRLNNNMGKTGSMLSYGWTVRHYINLFPSTTSKIRILPYLSYSLFLTQIRFDGIKGSDMGHMTRFDLGVDLKGLKRIHYFIAFSYAYNRYAVPLSESVIIHSYDVKTGIRF